MKISGKSNSKSIITNSSISKYPNINNSNSPYFLIILSNTNNKMCISDSNEYNYYKDRKFHVIIYISDINDMNEVIQIQFMFIFHL